MEVEEKKSRFEAYVEDYGIKPVPMEKTRNWFEMGIVIWGVSVCIPAFMLGGIMATSARLGPAVVAALLGALILTAISIATGMIGAHTRLSTAMSSKFTFGMQGNYLMAVLLGIGSFGWFGIQLEVFGQAITGAVDILSNGSLTIPRWIPIIAGGILMMSTALIGFKAIEKLSVWVIPVLLILMGVTLVKAYSGVSFAEVVHREPSSPLPFGLLVSIMAGAYAVGATIQPDITRYSHSKGHAVGGMIFGMLVGFPLIVILGSFLGAGTGIAGFTDMMLKYHAGAWGIFAMFTIVFATWTTNDNNLYSASLALNAIFTGLKKWHVTLIMGWIGTLLALFGILGQFVNWMIGVGVMLPPIAAVMAVEFFLFRSREFNYDSLRGMVSFRAITYISWVVAVAFGFLTFFKVFTFTSTPALDAIIVALILHFILMLATGHKISVLKKA